MNRHTQWIALERAKGIGPAGLCEIYSTLSSLNLNIEDLFALNEREIRSEFSFKEIIVNGIIQAQKISEDIDEDIIDMSEVKIRPIFIFEKNYPAMLKLRLKNEAPPILYCIGNTALLETRAVAVLGHGDMSPKGEMIAYRTAESLAAHSLTAISGMSKGTGIIVHRASLDAGGNTIGVLPCGMFSFTMSPRLQQNFDPDRFLIISPYYLRDDYSQFRGMERNRTICALSRAVFITEAPSPAEGGIFEAGKSCQKLQVPLFTTQYSDYPKSAAGNPVLINEYGATPVRGRKEGSGITPNIDALIAKAKF